ncbi:MAG: MBL fold metallo-hydrolase [Epsilonproteobacteria bacterium]|nr:MBL fold metallo-hydrolase [Campylobacterota bacterium]
MKIFVDKELGHVSYIYTSGEYAAVIDPKRDVSLYVKHIQDNSLKLKYIINTHPHADFISGDAELKYLYPDAEILQYEENEYFLGDTVLKIVKTPGHTPYCISCIVNDGIDRYMFSGDFLFAGSMGRIDLLGDEKIEELKALFYNSAKKVWDMGDEVVVLPSHIKGSFCAKEISENYITTIGIEKKTNKIFRHFPDKKLFLSKISHEFSKPLYAKKLPFINLDSSNKTLLKDIKECEEVNVTVDVRKRSDFVKGHVKKSINVPFDSNMAYILGSLVDISECIGIIGDKNTDYGDILIRLRNVGFDRVKILGDIQNFKTQPFRRNKKKSLFIEDIDLDYVLKHKEFNFECKNGNKAIAVESFLKGLE